MSDVSISVLSDPESARGGEAIIRIVGIGLVPPGSTFRIEPLDDEGADPPDGWPTGELKPRGLRITSDGVDLLVGPEVTRSPALLPGTPVVITVPSVSARSELRWPSLPVERAPSRGAVVMTAEQRAAELAARAEAERAAAARAAVEAEALERETAAAAAKLDLPAATAAAAPPANPAPGALAVAEPVLPPPAVPPRPGDAAALGPPLPPKPAPLRPVLPASPPVHPIARSPAHPPPQTAGRGDAPAHWWTGKAAPFVVGCLVAGGVLGGLWSTQMRQAGLGATQPGAIVLATDRTGTFAAPGLAAILDVPARSPLGHPATGVDLAEALQRADTSLHGAPGAEGRQEAKFWLRKALSLGLGDERLLWAMTQLGTLYASAAGETPDYASARLLWELASAQGDPIAQCFLATLYEQGLGAPQDRKRALELYQRARSGGGCSGVDAAIARLKKEPS